jgi:transcriptional regulator with XRE-family HTH domain
MTEATEKIRERILALIDSEFESDASFERELGLSEKTVSNWRRGRSASFMRHLPELSELFGVNVGELLDIPLSAEGDQLSEEEIALLTLYRKSHILPKKMRRALTETLESTINMYIAAGDSRKKK